MIISLHNLLILSCDRSNFNKSTFNLVNDFVKSVRGKPLLDFGICNIHIAHNQRVRDIKN